MTSANDLAAIANGIAFGIPGGGPSLELVDAIEKNGGRFHTTKFEGSAALMAGTVGRLRGTAGVAVSIKGPGLANLASGLATAWLEDLPVVAISEAFGPADGARMHKRIHHPDLVRGIVKGYSGTGDSQNVSQLIKLADEERPGPVLLDLAHNDPWIAPKAAVHPRNSELVLRTISQSQRPVVIVGGLGARCGLSAALNRLQIPVFSTASSKGVVDESGSFAAGVYTGAGAAMAPETAILASADLIVGIGLRTRELLGTRFPVPVVNIDDIDDTAGWTPLATADSENAARVIEELLGCKGWGQDIVEASRHLMLESLLAGPFLPAHALRTVQRHLPGARLALDTGFFCTIGEHVWDVARPELYISSGQGRSMGATLPMAIAAAISRPEVPTVLAIGDGGLGMFAAEMTLAASEKAPLLALFFCDGTYASVRDRAVETNLTQRPLVIKHPKWVDIALAFGFVAHRVDNADDLGAVVKNWDPNQGPAFVEIGFDPEPYRVMTRKLRL